MNFSANTRHIGRAVGISLTLGAVLAGCGGGDGPILGVSVSLNTPTYNQPLVLTVNNVSAPVAVTATGCTGLALSTTAPYISTATTLYYQCNANTVGAGQFVVTRVSDATVLATQAFTVPAPQVTLALLSTPKYSQPLVLAVNSVSSPVAVTATGCTGLALSTTAPYVSTATTAYYVCNATTVGAGQFNVTRVSDAVVLGTQPFTVPVPQVTLTFSNGAAVNDSMVFTLAPDKAPITVNNFLNYVNSGFYVGTVIHRVAPNFVIQGGGFAAQVVDATATLKPVNAPIALEVGVGLSNTQWTVAMARTSNPNSATSQFFINLVNNSAALDPGPTAGYAVFGSVTNNTALVTQIAAAPCNTISGFTSTGECIPAPNVVITAASQTQ